MMVHSTSVLLISYRQLVHQPTFTPRVLRIGLLQVVGGACDVASTTGGKDAEGLAGEVVGFDEGVDDSGCRVPPYREANPDGVVLCDIGAGAFDGGT